MTEHAGVSAHRLIVPRARKKSKRIQLVFASARSRWNMRVSLFPECTAAALAQGSLGDAGRALGRCGGRGELAPATGKELALTRADVGLCVRLRAGEDARVGRVIVTERAQGKPATTRLRPALPSRFHPRRGAGAKDAAARLVPLETTGQILWERALTNNAAFASGFSVNGGDSAQEGAAILVSDIHAAVLPSVAARRVSATGTALQQSSAG